MCVINEFAAKSMPTEEITQIIDSTHADEIFSKPNFSISTLYPAHVIVRDFQSQAEFLSHNVYYFLKVLCKVNERD